jgi:hypothetical protein
MLTLGIVIFNKIYVRRPHLRLGWGSAEFGQRTYFKNKVFCLIYVFVLSFCPQSKQSLWRLHISAESPNIQLSQQRSFQELQHQFDIGQ